MSTHPNLVEICCGLQLASGIGGSDIQVRYRNKQSHKFFAYKSIEDTSWEKIYASTFENEDVTADFVKERATQGAIIEKATFSL